MVIPGIAQRWSRRVPTLLALACTPCAWGAGLAAPADVPAALAVPAGATLARIFSAKGVQIFRCQAAASEATAAGWVLVGPEAQLFDTSGRRAGRHYAGPTWEGPDGATVTGKVLAKVPAPDGKSAPWLLLSASAGIPGSSLAGVTHVQRLYTNGGAAPQSSCTPANGNAQERVPYTAAYFFYTGP